MTNTGAKFMEYFNSVVLPQAYEVERKRIKLFNICSVWGVIVFGACLFWAVSLLPAKLDDLDLLVPPLFAIIFPMVFLVFSPIKLIRKIYGIDAKERLLPLIIGFWGNFYYDAPTNLAYAISRAVKENSGFKGFLYHIKRKNSTNISIKPRTLARLLNFESISYDDKILGKYKDTDIELSELRTYYTTRDSKGNTSTHTTFKGVVFSAVLNKKFNGLTIISNSKIDKGRAELPPNSTDMLSNEEYAELFKTNESENEDGKSNKWFEVVSPEQMNKVVNKGKILKVKDVMLEDPEFMKRFKVCASDQVEARYILTTAFINRFLKMSESFHYKTKAIFIDENIYILVDIRKNWFEIPFFKPSCDVNNYKEFLNDFTRLLAILETLKLNQNIGM